MKISVFGIGYVGAVSAACLARQGHTVIAVDKDPAKVARLSEGKSPFLERDLDELIARGVGSGLLSATQDAMDAITDSDVTLICVGTPSLADGRLDMSYVLQACKEIGQALRSQDRAHTIIMRSTLLPGSTAQQCVPAIEQASGKRCGRDFFVGYNPEFLREGSAVADYFDPPKIVVGADDENTTRLIMDIYEGIDAPRITTSMEVAEAVKYADNIWHGLKVGFANELGNVLKASGVDSHRVMDIFCQDRKLNISPAYLSPGFAFGGSCLPKDINALRGLARSAGIATPLFDALMQSNTAQIDRAFHMIAATGARRVSLLGLSFKPGSDDIRESPLLALGQRLVDAGYELKIFDPGVANAAQNGVTVPSLGALANMLSAHHQDMVTDTDVIVIGHHSAQSEAVMACANDDVPVIDLVRLNKTIEQRKGYHGICW